MIVTAALPWWGELPDVLEACVKGVANVADRLVALDGAYRRYPDGTPHSTPDQVAAIRETAAANNIECIIIQPDQLWAGQVQKRSYLLAMATVGSDWIVTVDADHIIYTERAAFRSELAGVAEDVIDVPYWTPKNPSRSVEQSSAGIWHRDQVGVWVDIPHIYRALPGLRIERFHWWYSAVRQGRRVWLWSGDHSGMYPTVQHRRLGTPYQVNHLCLMRTKEQIRAARAFLNDREKIVAQTGQEDELPGMPPPVFDYTHIPA